MSPTSSVRLSGVLNIRDSSKAATAHCHSGDGKREIRPTWRFLARREGGWSPRSGSSCDHLKAVGQFSDHFDNGSEDTPSRAAREIEQGIRK
jgi:hypothetical protein